MARQDTYLGGAVRATIAAPREALWAIVADPARHPELAGSAEPQETRLLTEGPLRVGARFESHQKAKGVHYRSRSLVIACEEPGLLRWQVHDVPPWPPTSFALAWEFRFDPADGGTRVTHSYRWGIDVPVPLAVLLIPVRRWRNRNNVRFMVGTLRNLARLVGAPAPQDIQVSHQVPAMGEASPSGRAPTGGAGGAGG
jgi:uncharacterized protein YndB with AHSA1/START domain